MLRRIILTGLLFAAFAAFAADDFESKAALGESQLRQELHRLARPTLEQAARLAATPEQAARAEGLLGLADYQAQRREPAEAHLDKAIQSGLGAPGDRARWLAALADLRAAQGGAAAALRLYDEALALAGDDPALAASVRLQRIPLLPSERRLPELKEVRAALAGIGDPKVRARRLIGLAARAEKLGSEGRALAESALDQARRDAGTDARLRAEALDGLARLDEDRGDRQSALRRNGEAIAAAQAVGAHDLLMELEWREGRLYRSLGRKPEALAAYRLAVEHLQAIRDDIPVEYHDGRSSFRATLEPLYLGLAELLLDQADQKAGSAQADLLRQARDTVELIKQSEIEDFLGGRCAVHRAETSRLDAIESRTAVLYPIVLPDRLALLASAGGELRAFRQDVDAQTVQDTARRLAADFRNDRPEAMEAAQKLYRWLVAPAEPWLKQQRAETLVIVPDGALRLVPLGALHDGRGYLIERYAVAVSPGLDLFDPAPLQQRGLESLLAGMSEPGSVVEHLPAAIYRSMAEARGAARGRGPASRALPLGPEEGAAEASERGERDIERLRQDPEFRRKLQEDLKLPGVAEEIRGIERQLPNTLLLNETFTVGNLERELLARPHTVVHIASHGVFGSTAASSFIMAYDDIIDMDRLERLLKSERFQQQPVELLTLSACQTAEGDDRAPLGISGIALKARVRSALGSLWPVSDEAASKLMAEFYGALAQPGASKVQALRQAQLSLLRDPKLARPFFWSPFILVGNWL
jgi:CHAT domain-containing protein